MENKRVVILTPCYDGKITCQYANSLKETILLGLNLGVNVIPVYIAFDALVQKARNDLFAFAYKNNVDDLFFIDADVEWDEKWFFKLLNYKAHIVGGTYRKKTDVEEKYVVNIFNINTIKIEDNGLIEVEGLGLGFCRIDNYAIKKVWEHSEKYTENNEEKRMIFNVELKDGCLISEDISFFKHWIALDEKVYLDPSITCGHSGQKTFYGNFNEYFKKITEVKHE